MAGLVGGALQRCAESGRLVINPIIYAEVSIGFSRIEDLDAGLPGECFTPEPLPWEAAFLAGKAFTNYRGRRGTRVHPLPDFYIGAHDSGVHTSHSLSAAVSDLLPAPQTDRALRPRDYGTVMTTSLVGRLGPTSLAARTRT